MKKVFLTITALSLINFCFSQITFEKTFGGSNADYGYSVTHTSDSGYIIAGYTQSFGAGGKDVYIIKTNANGDTLWIKTFGGYNDDIGYSVIQTNDGEYIIAGETQSFGAGTIDVYLIKTNTNGDTLWTKTFGGINYDRSYSIRQTSDNGYIIAGGTQSFGAGNVDVYLIKTNTNGDTLWTKTFGGTGFDYGNSVIQTSDSGYIVAGYTESFGTGKLYLIRTNANGDTLWTKTFSGKGGAVGNSVTKTNDNGFIIAGYTTDFVNVDVYLIKTDANVDTLWTKTFGGADIDYNYSITQTSNNGYIIAGTTGSFGANSGNVYLIKTNADGDTLWTKVFGGIYNEEGYSVIQTSDGGYIIVGRTFSFGAGNCDVYLIKTDENGNIITNTNDDKKVFTGLSIFPNPTNNKITIKSFDYNITKVAILNINGQLLQNLTLHASETSINTDNLERGLYILKIYTEKEVITKKLIKE